MSIFPALVSASKRPVFGAAVLMSTVSILALSQPSFAEEGHDHDKRHAESHVHGAAELAFALDGSKLVATFASPAMNIVGFEHEAREADEVSAVEAAVQKLRQGAELFAFEGGECALSEADVAAEGLLPEDGHDDHGDHDDHDDHDEDAHSEFEAKYTFECGAPSDISSISVSFFTLWSGIEEIETVFLSADHQLSVELDATKSKFEIE